MRKVCFAVTAVAVLILMTGCTDAAKAQWGALGNKGDVTCYSGGQVIYKGRSSGKILTEAQSDGWMFKDDSTGKLVRLSGDCVIVN